MPRRLMLEAVIRRATPGDEKSRSTDEFLAVTGLHNVNDGNVVPTLRKEKP